MNISAKTVFLPLIALGAVCGWASPAVANGKWDTLARLFSRLPDAGDAKAARKAAEEMAGARRLNPDAPALDEDWRLMFKADLSQSVHEKGLLTDPPTNGLDERSRPGGLSGAIRNSARLSSDSKRDNAGDAAGNPGPLRWPKVMPVAVLGVALLALLYRGGVLELVWPRASGSREPRGI